MKIPPGKPSVSFERTNRQPWRN